MILCGKKGTEQTRKSKICMEVLTFYVFRNATMVVTNMGRIPIEKLRRNHQMKKERPKTRKWGKDYKPEE